MSWGAYAPPPRRVGRYMRRVLQCLADRTDLGLGPSKVREVAVSHLPTVCGIQGSIVARTETPLPALPGTYTMCLPGNEHFPAWYTTYRYTPYSPAYPAPDMSVRLAVKTLIAGGYVRAWRDSNPRRTWLLAVTDLGRTALAR